MKRFGRDSRRRCRLPSESGSIMLEVIVAAMLVGLILGTLATALAGTVAQARVVQDKAGALPVSADAQSPGSWEWGPRVARAWWRPGPVLHVKVAGGPGAPSSMWIGLWADGWLKQEVVLPQDASDAEDAEDLSLDSWEWTGLAGQELVIRVRTSESGWGPPWRSSIPDAAGGHPAAGAASPGMAVTPTAVIHRPQASASGLDVSWNAGALVSPPFGLLFVLQQDIIGWAGATLDGREQWWWMEEERDVDLYF